MTAASRLLSLRDRLLFRRKESLRRGEVPRKKTISHARGSLEAVFQPAGTTPRAAILLLHGIGDRLKYWNDAQQLLAESEFASLVFHYSGYGHSSGTLTPENLAADTCIAYDHLRTLVPADTSVFVLGFSMGTGVIAEVMPRLDPPANGLILCQAFSSLRAAAARACSSRLLAQLMPALWITVDSIQQLCCPLLLVHTTADPLFPASMAHEIEAAASVQSRWPVTVAKPAGRGHNDVYLYPRDGYWEPILKFLHLHSERAEGLINARESGFRDDAEIH